MEYVVVKGDKKAQDVRKDAKRKMHNGGRTQFAPTSCHPERMVAKCA